VVLLCACKLGFDARIAPPDAPDTAFIDAAIDTPIDTPVGTTTITFGERPTSQRKIVSYDTALAEALPTQNNGAAQDLALEAEPNNRFHSLLRFDLTSVAPGTQLVAARVKLVRLDYGDEVNGAIVIYRITESWVEGTGDAMVVLPGATWQARDGTTVWTTTGGTISTMLAMLTPPSVAFDVALPVAVVQEWIDDPQINHGMLLKSVAEPTHVHLHQSDSTATDLRPELELVLVP